MGLLDDAIREHLELKRRRGADPGEVAREEHDALSPVPREAELDPSLDPGLDYEADDELPPASLESSMPVDLPADPDSTVAAGSAHDDQRETKVVQETVEIDMHSELGDGPSAPVAGPAPAEGRSAPVGHPAHTRVPDEESLEWEVPTESAGDPAGEPGAPTKAGIGTDPAGQDAGEHPDDVLEETPDFLRDTPEQERLWFEQRPPRDFDFNE